MSAGRKLRRERVEARTGLRRGNLQARKPAARAARKPRVGEDSVLSDPITRGGVRGDGVLHSWQPADPTAGSWISGARDLRLQAPGKLKSRSITVLRPSLRALSTAWSHSLRTMSAPPATGGAAVRRHWLYKPRAKPQASDEGPVSPGPRRQQSEPPPCQGRRRPRTHLEQVDSTGLSRQYQKAQRLQRTSSSAVTSHLQPITCAPNRTGWPPPPELR